MWMLRKEHMEALSAYMRQGFDDRMVKHLRTDFPQESGKMDEKQLREFIDSGVKKASTYTIEPERDVCRFIDLMVGLGADFDKARDMVWARTILRDPALPSGSKLDLIEHRLSNGRAR